MFQFRAILVSASAFALLLSACATHKGGPTSSAKGALPLTPRTYLRSDLPAPTLVILSEQYLEWQKGLAVQIRDHQQGLVVTEWAHDENPHARFRVTIRVTPDPLGS